MNNKQYPDWVLKHKRKGTQVHRIKDKYYLYEVTSKWDPQLKRAKKITTAYLGRISREGLKKSTVERYKPSSIKEYGAGTYIIEDNKIITSTLKKYFPTFYSEIFILSVLRFFYHCPLKNMGIYYTDSWLSEEFSGARLSKDSLTHILEAVGHRREDIVSFLKEFIGGEEKLLIDLTHIFTKSKGVNLAQKGFNSDLEFIPQVNLLFIFSAGGRLPLFYRLLPGSVRDVATMAATIAEAGISEVIIIADKGFYSESNIGLLKDNNLSYIIPLKRNSTLIDTGILEKGTKASFEGYFKFGGRYIFYYRCESTIPVYVYLDDELKVQEVKDYLARIETHPEFGYSLDNFKKLEHSFGTISLVTNLKEPAPKIYSYFKTRVGVEQAFDAFKNTISADGSYMRNDFSMEGWMFINYLALLYYYKIYNRLLDKELLSRYSPSDVILHLSRCRKARTSDGWIDLEIPKQTRMLAENLGVILPIT
ncbi:MAG: transposase [Actinobacteria bacterium]|nr:transposase [Actinomycetota bacterium]